jgi:hypothetical protein
MPLENYTTDALADAIGHDDRPIKRALRAGDRSYHDPDWRLLCLAFGMCACSSRMPRPDLVTRWNEQAVAVGGPAIQRTLAMVPHRHVRRSERHRASLQTLSLATCPPKRALAEASAAAYGVLVRLFPDQAPTLRMTLASALVSVPEGPQRGEGLRYGDLVAQAICAARLGDHILMPGPIFTPDSTPGRYQLTTPGPRPTTGKVVSQSSFSSLGRSFRFGYV